MAPPNLRPGHRALYACVVGWAVLTVAGCHGSQAPGEASGHVTNSAQVGAPPTPPKAPVRRVWMRAVGDVMLARGIQRQWEGDQGLAYLFAATRPLLRAPDIAFANLESTVAAMGRTQKSALAFRSHPNGIYAIADAGFDVVSLSNNHAEDFGPVSLQETVWRLKREGIAAAGVPRPGQARAKHVVLVRHGLRVAFLAFSIFRPSKLRISDSPASMELIADEMRAADADADLVVASFHWGAEYQRLPTDQQRTLGRAAIDAGADIVLGHHPHRLQGVEIYRGHAIAYSLGNFLFDQPWRPTRDSMILDWKAWEDGRQSLTLIPARITTDPYAPRIPPRHKAESLINNIKAMAAELGTETVIEDGAVVVLGVGDPDVAAGNIDRVIAAQ